MRPDRFPLVFAVCALCALTLSACGGAAARPTVVPLPIPLPAPTVTPAAVPTGSPTPASAAAPTAPPERVSPPLTAADLAHLEPLYSIPLPGGGSRFAFSPDGSLLAVFDRPAGNLTLYDSSSGQALRSFTHPPSLACLTFAASGATLLTCGEGGELYLWDAQTLALIASQPSDGEVLDLALSPDGGKAAVYSRSRNLRLFDTRTLEQIAYTRPGFSRQPASIRFSPDGDLLYAFATYDRQVLRFSLPRLRRETPFEFEAVVSALALDPGGNYLAAALANGSIQVVRAAGGEAVLTLRDRQTAPAWLQFWGDPLTLSAENGGGVITGWRLPGGEPALEARVQPGQSAAAFAVRLRQPSPDGRLLLLCADRRLLLLGQDSPQPLFSLDASATRWDGCAFSPAGDRFAALEWTRQLTVFGLR